MKNLEVKNLKNYYEVFEEAGINDIELQEDLLEKKNRLSHLKAQLISEKDTLSALNSSIKSYSDSISTLKQKVYDVKTNKDNMFYELNKGKNILTKQEKNMAEIDRQIEFKKEQIPKIYDKEMLKLKIYEEEFERLIEEIKYFNALKEGIERIKSEAK